KLSWRTASRSEPRDTPSSVASSASVGRRSPSTQRRVRIMAASSSTARSVNDMTALLGDGCGRARSAPVGGLSEAEGRGGGEVDEAWLVLEFDFDDCDPGDGVALIGGDRFDDDPPLLLLEGEFLTGGEDANVADVTDDAADDQLAAHGPDPGPGVDRGAPAAHVAHAVADAPVLDQGVDFAVGGVAVGLEPAPHGSQGFDGLGGHPSLGVGADVEEEVAAAG